MAGGWNVPVGLIVSVGGGSGGEAGGLETVQVGGVLLAGGNTLALMASAIILLFLDGRMLNGNLGSFSGSGLSSITRVSSPLSPSSADVVVSPSEVLTAQYLSEKAVVRYPTIADGTFFFLFQ